MIDPKNTVIITAGIVADPEIVNDSILKARVAIDYAGQERDSDNKSGYFDLTYYLNSDENSRNAKFVRDQVSSSKMAKGSQVQIVGRLVQERWKAEDGSNRSKTVVVAEAMTYAGGGARNTESSSTTSTASAASASYASAPDEF